MTAVRPFVFSLVVVCRLDLSLTYLLSAGAYSFADIAFVEVGRTRSWDFCATA